MAARGIVLHRKALSCREPGSHRKIGIIISPKKTINKIFLLKANMDKKGVPLGTHIYCWAESNDLIKLQISPTPESNGYMAETNGEIETKEFR